MNRISAFLSTRDLAFMINHQAARSLSILARAGLAEICSYRVQWISMLFRKYADIEDSEVMYNEVVKELSSYPNLVGYIPRKNSAISDR
jgi:hypothetical protein